MAGKIPLAPEANLRTSRFTFSLLIILTIAFAAMPLLQAQVALEKLPYSGGVLMSRAMRQGRVQLHPGSMDELVNGVAMLTCTPAPCVFTPVRASNAGSQPANEYPIAYNPTNNLQLITGANDYNCSNIQGFYTSGDGGTTWNHACTKGSGGEGDPVAGYDLLGNTFSGGIQSGNFVIFTSTDNGTTWSNPITVTKPLLGYLADKPWMEVDTSSSSAFVNNVYYSGTQFSSTSNSEISVSRSSDHGQTWATVAVDTQQHFPTFVDQFSDLAIGADGTVYLNWIRCPANGSAGDCGGTVTNIMFSKSTDGGATWSTPAIITTTTLAPDACFCAFYGSLPNTSERISDIPSNTASGSGSTAKVLVTYYNWTGTFMQVMAIASTDGGTTWGTPSIVDPTSTKGDQFFMWANHTSGGGRLAVTWLDRRNDTANKKYQPFFAMSANGGSSFAASHIIDSTLSDPTKDGFGGSFFGDYRTHVFTGKTIYADWPDTNFTGSTAQDAVGGAQLK
jgi:hypothetical protein